MANKVIFLCLYILSSIILLPGVENAKLGLTIKLIHRDSPESPLYQPNLTPQRTQNLVLQSKARVKRLRNERLQPSNFNSGTNLCVRKLIARRRYVHGASEHRHIQDVTAHFLLS